MELFSAGIPFIIIIIICLAILFSYILFRTSDKQRTRSNQSIYFKLGLYVIILLVSMGLVLFIPIEHDLEGIKNYQTNDIPSLYGMAHQGELHDSANDFLVYQKEFEYKGQQLNIHPVFSEHQWFKIYVLIEEKSEEDSMIEASFYQTPSFFDGADITTDLEPYKIELHADVLTITAKDSRLSYAFFKTEFPFSQFEKNRQPMFEEEMYAGEQLVYLRIPKNMKIDTHEQINLFYAK